jgi:hypothetical protein
VVCIVGLLPGLLINIGGGSTGYFFGLQELIAVCILLGFNIPSQLQQKLQYQSIKLRNGVVACMILLTVVLLYNSKTVNAFIKVTNTPNCTSSTLLTNVQEIMKIPTELKKEYCIFLDGNAEIWDI